MMNMYSSPRFSSPTRYPTAPSPTSPLPEPYSSTAVGLPCMPSLCSSEAHQTSLRSPSDPSSLTRNLGTMNSEIPLTPLGASGVRANRSEEHTSELQSLMRISYAVFCLKKKKDKQ